MNGCIDGRPTSMRTFSMTTPDTASFSRIRESFTVTATCAARQSRTKRSVPALKMGVLVIGLTLVRYTSSSLTDLSADPRSKSA